MKYLELLLILLITFISTSAYSISAGVLEIKDTVVERAIIYKIPVYGTIPATSANEIQIELVFNSIVIDIQNVIGSSSYGLPLDLKYNMDLSNLTQSKIIISSSSFKNNYTGVLFELEIVGLAGSDTISYIEPISMKMDSIPLDGVDLISGKIKVNSFPVGTKYQEGLVQNYPNPFNEYTKIPFTIDNETKVNFNIFSVNGRRLNEAFNLDDIFNIEVLDENDKIIEKPDEYIFTRGSYRIILTPYMWKLSSGAYMFIMRTNGNIYRMNFIYIK